MSIMMWKMIFLFSNPIDFLFVTKLGIMLREISLSSVDGSMIRIDSIVIIGL